MNTNRSILKHSLLILAALALPLGATAQARPLKVFILAGQSNMVGHGKVETGRDAAWPPESMKALPADYLDRLRHALQLQSDTFNNPKFKEAKEANVGTVRTAIAALALGQHGDELNALFEAEGFRYESNKKFGFSLFSLPYVRLYALFNDRTGVMKGRPHRGRSKPLSKLLDRPHRWGATK